MLGLERERRPYLFSIPTQLEQDKGLFMIVIRLIFSIIHSLKVSGRNIKGLYVNVTINEQTMTISPLY